MKKLSVLFLILLLAVSCTKEHPKDFLTISGKLENNTDSIISIMNRSGVVKKINIDSTGIFKDTLKVEKADVYTFSTSRLKRAPVFLKNGFDITINGDANKFMKSFKYSGKGAENSEYVVSQIMMSQKIGNPQLILNLKEEDFNKKLDMIKKDYDSLLNSYRNLDSSLVAMGKQQSKQVFDYFKNTYARNLTMGKGKPSPKFENYVNIKGGTKSLDSFKGKYVYIDVWATWCGPCIKEIPSLQKLEKDYHKKNIAFVSISTDESRRSGGSWEKAEQKWRDFVKAKNMSGVHLWSGKDFEFQRAYQINTIPRFILIDPNGNIVDANAPRPSDPRLRTLFTSLGI